MSLYRLNLNVGGICEPHWHANANELGIVLVTLFASGNHSEQILLEAGDAFFSPYDTLHSLENVGEEPCELVLQFSHNEPEDFGLSAAFGEFSDGALGNAWQQPATVFRGMSRSAKDVFAVLRTTPMNIPDQSRKASIYRYHLAQATPLIGSATGLVRVARSNVWPILTRQALYTLELSETGMREAHWHPETAELGFVKQVRGRMSILSPNGDGDTYEMKEGDVYFIPKAYPHHIENLGKEPLHLLIIFDQAMPKDIGFTASVRAYSDEVLCPVLGVSAQFFKQFPKYYEDLYIVKKKNPTD